jgi:hypothetical protein
VTWQEAKQEVLVIHPTARKRWVATGGGWRCEIVLSRWIGSPIRLVGRPMEAEEGAWIEACKRLRFSDVRRPSI